MKFLSTLRPYAWGAVGGAVGWWVILAFVFGWMAPGSAHRRAENQAQQAVVAALAPVCADSVLAQADVAEKRVALSRAMSWERRDLLPADLVTLPGEDSPDPDLVAACTKIVLESPKAAEAPIHHDAAAAKGNG